MNELPDNSAWPKTAMAELRRDVMRTIRDFFDSQGYLELDMPLLTPFPTLDINIQSIEAGIHVNGRARRSFLHTSPEHAMKKCLARGARRIYFLGKVFRDDEFTSLHNPEYTMLEWYCSHSDYRILMEQVRSLILRVIDSVNSRMDSGVRQMHIPADSPWKIFTIDELFRKHAGFSLDSTREPSSLYEAAGKCGVAASPEDSWDTLFFRIYLEKIEPILNTVTEPFFLVDYPLPLGLMAKSKPMDPFWTERVELVIGGMELANGYSECLDSRELRQRMTEDRKRRLARGMHYPIDSELLSLLKNPLPPFAGMALGVDRLIMLLSGTNDIREVLLFPLHSWYQSPGRKERP